MDTTSPPQNQIYINAQQSLLQRFYDQAPASAKQNGIAQVGIVVLFWNNGNNSDNTNIYVNSQGELVNANGDQIDSLSFGGPGQTFNGGKAYIALSGQLDWKTANAFKNSSGQYGEDSFSFENALFYQVNLDSFEFTFSNSPFDGANLTSVGWFSIPMRMWVPGNINSANRSGFQSPSNQQNWVEAVQGLVPSGSNIFKDAAGNFLIAASPTTSPFSNQSFAWQSLPTPSATEITVANNLNYYPNQIVQFGESSGGTLPDPLKPNTNYYVLSYENTTGVLAVSDTPGGAAIQFTIAGSNAPDLTVTITTPDYPTEAYPSFDNYVNDFIGWLPALPTGEDILTDSPYSISGYFNGAPSDDAGQQIWHNNGFYNYQIYYDATKQNIVLIPGTQITSAGVGVSQVQGILAISTEELKNSVIATNGNYTVYDRLSDYANNTPYNYTTQFPTGNTPTPATTKNTINTGSNNQWGPIFANLATGFVAGYWRGDDPSQHTDQFNNSNFWSFFNADGTPKAFSNSNPDFFDPYSKLFTQNSNSYSGNYTDNLEKSLSLGSPLLNVGEASSDSSIYVSLLDINNLPTATMPPSGDINSSFANFTWNGYQDPIQLAPSELKPSNLSTLPSLQASALSVAIDFSSQMITLDTEQINYFSLKSSDGNFTGKIEPYSGAGNYQLSLENGNQTLNYKLANQPEGFFQLVQLPLPIAPTTNNLTTEYTLDFLDVQKSKEGVVENQTTIYTVKFYLTTDNTGNALPQDQAGKPNNLAVSTSGYSQTTTPDGKHLSTLKLSPINPSGLTQLSPQLWDYNSSFLGSNPTANNLNQPWAPLVWTENSTSYVLSSDYNSIAPGPGNYTLPTDLSSGELTFSWLGGPNSLGSGTDQPSYSLPRSFVSLLSGYTNKTFASASGKVQFVKGPKGLAPLDFEADIDGQWAAKTISATPLPKGTYTINFTQTLTDAQGKPLSVGYIGNTTNSHSSTFTVAPTTGLNFQSNAQGLVLIPSSGSTSSGQWVNITIDSWQKSDNSTFVLYATNTAGELISRDQTQVGGTVTLTEATLAKIGVVVTDNGTLLEAGQASVYLRTDQFLRLAVISGDGNVIEDLPVTNKIAEDGQGDIAFLSTEAFTLKGNLTNTLSSATLLATAQLQQDEPIYFFNANSTIQIEASGSCVLTNNLKWVPVEFDPLTGQKRVGGVAAADTDEFRNALKQNALDFTLTGGGTGDKFDITENLAIQTEGYYAPFLETSAGNTFFIGSSANPSNRSHFRLFGDAVFGIEDLPSSGNSDFDFNDMVVRMTPVT